MKPSIILFFICTALITTQAGFFIGPTTPSNRLIVAEGEAMIITGATRGNIDLRDASCFYTLHLGANVFADFLWLIEGSPFKQNALAGPAELVFTNSVGISFRMMPNSAIRTVVVTPESFASIDVPDGKTVHFFTTLLPAEVQITVGSATTSGWLEACLEVSGPANVVVKCYSSHRTFVSYYFADNTVIIPQLGIIQGPTGPYQMMVEKSSDLTNWFPIILHDAIDNTHGYFRLRMSR